MAQHVADRMADASQLTFAIVPVKTGRAAGFRSLMRIDSDMGSIEVGEIALGPTTPSTNTTYATGLRADVPLL